MSESGIQFTFWIVFGIGLLIAVVTLLGVAFHVAVFGTVFGLIVKRLREAHADQGAAAAGDRCGHCGTAITAGAAECASCGAPVA